jgi:tRNA pseudouridine38-40 synthase
VTFRYVAEVSYDGGAFFGFQRQNGLMTVQGALEDALSVLAKGDVCCVGAGRTDRGVHARGQVVHFDMPSRWDPRRLRLAIKGSLPPGIEVIRVSEAPPGFHARYGAVFREYRYFVWNAPWRYPHLGGVTWHVRRPLDHRRLSRLAGFLVGERDFGAFCRSADRRDNTVRHMMRASVRRKGPLLVFTFRADGFLTNMVRILVGTMVEVELGTMSEGEFVGLLGGGDRSMSGRTAPPEGLFFWRVHYDPSPWSCG